MSEQFKRAVCLWMILFIGFNAVCFISSSDFSSPLSYKRILFDLILIAQLGEIAYAYKNGKSHQIVLGIPFIGLGCIATLIMVICGIAMVLSASSNMFGIILSIGILFLMGLAATKKSSVELMIKSEEQIKDKTVFIKSLTAASESLHERAKSEEIKAACKWVYEALRYCDPVSSSALSHIERQIEQQFSILVEAVKEEDCEAVKTAAEKLIVLIDDRSRKCKLTK